MAKKKTSAMIAQPGTPADGYTLNVKYDPENNDAFEAKAIFNDGTVKSLGSGGSGGGVFVVNLTYDGNVTDTADKTWREIYDALQERMPVVMFETPFDTENEQQQNVYHVQYASNIRGEYQVLAVSFGAEENGTLINNVLRARPETADSICVFSYL